MEAISPFGSRTRTRVLLALEGRGQSYPRELARLLAAPFSVVLKAVRSLEEDALVAGRMVGRTRVLELNPGFFALAQLRAFLAALARADDTFEARAPGGRSRARRKERARRELPASQARPGRSGGEGRAGEVRDKWRVW